jgi:hypothetical protein
MLAGAPGFSNIFAALFIAVAACPLLSASLGGTFIGSFLCAEHCFPPVLCFRRRVFAFLCGQTVWGVWKFLAPLHSLWVLGSLRSNFVDFECGVNCSMGFG